MGNYQTYKTKSHIPPASKINPPNQEYKKFHKYLKENQQEKLMLDFSTKLVHDVYLKNRSMKRTCPRINRFSYKFVFHEQDMMSEISKAFVKKYNGVWTCLAGPNTVYGTYPRPQNFIQFDIKEHFGLKRCFCRIIIFQNSQEVRELQENLP